MDGLLNWGAVVWQFAKPSSLLILAFLLGLVLTRSRYYDVGRRLAWIAGSLIVICGLLPVGYWLLSPLQNRFPKPPFTAPPALVILLTGAEQTQMTSRHGDVHVNSFGDRLLAMAELAHEFDQATLMISGGLGRGLTQADAAGRFIASTGVGGSRIILDRFSTRTADSAEFVGNYISETETVGPIWLVTSAFHMPRAIASFRAHGIDPVPYPTDYREFRLSGPNAPIAIDVPENLFLLDLAAHEWVGLVAYRLTGRSDELLPAPD